MPTKYARTLNVRCNEDMHYGKSSRRFRSNPLGSCVRLSAIILMYFFAYYCDDFVSVAYTGMINMMVLQAIATRDAMAKCLYGALFDWIVLQLNYSLLSKRDDREHKVGTGRNPYPCEEREETNEEPCRKRCR